MSTLCAFYLATSDAGNKKYVRHFLTNFSQQFDFKRHERHSEYLLDSGYVAGVAGLAQLTLLVLSGLL